MEGEPLTRKVITIYEHLPRDAQGYFECPFYCGKHLNISKATYYRAHHNNNCDPSRPREAKRRKVDGSGATTGGDEDGDGDGGSREPRPAAELDRTAETFVNMFVPSDDEGYSDIDDSSSDDEWGYEHAIGGFQEHGPSEEPPPHANDVDWGAEDGRKGSYKWYRHRLSHPIVAGHTQTLLQWIEWAVARKYKGNMPVREFNKWIKELRRFANPSSLFPKSWDQIKSILAVPNFYENIRHLCPICGLHVWDYLPKSDYASHKKDLCPLCERCSTQSFRFEQDKNGPIRPVAWVFEVPLEEVIGIQLFGNAAFVAAREEFIADVMVTKPSYVFRFTPEGKRIDDYCAQKYNYRPMQDRNASTFSFYYDEFQSKKSSVRLLDCYKCTLFP